jgi:hypothetical protein
VHAERTRGKGREQTTPRESSPRSKTPGQLLDGGGAANERFTVVAVLGFAAAAASLGARVLGERGGAVRGGGFYRGGGLLGVRARGQGRAQGRLGSGMTAGPACQR